MKKAIAPIIITILTVIGMGLTAAMYLFTFKQLHLPGWISVLIAVVFAAFIFAMLYILTTRLEEIAKEKDDDYSQY